MLTKIYAGLWLVYFLTAGVFYLTGSMTMLALVGFGFVAFGMVFMGMMGVLPSTVVHHGPALAKVEVETTTATERIGNRIRSYKESLSPNGVAVHKPRHP